MPSYKYPLLNDEEWLRDQYVAKQRSTKEITAIVGAKTSNSVRQALMRFDIPLCTYREGLTRNRAEDGFLDNRSVLDGCLLGDGCLSYSYKPSEQACPYFKKRNKHREHVEYVAQQLFAHAPEQRIKQTTERLRQKSFEIYSLRSLSHDFLTLYYQRWYASGRKVVPRDLVVDERLLLHWFLDDGSSYQRRRESKTHQVIICFSSECFTLEDQQWLCAQINAKYGLQARPAPCNSGTGHRIVLAQVQTQQFFSIIGPPPFASLAYKWKITG